MEEDTNQQPEEAKTFSRQQLEDGIERLKKELEETGREPTEMEGYCIRHALTHFDRAYPNEVASAEGKPAGE